MSLEADLAEGNIRLKRWMDAAKDIVKDGKPLIVNPGEPHLYASKLWPLASRFRVIEHRKFATMIDGGKDADDTIGKIFSAECCMASAPNFGEAIIKYTKRVVDPNRDDLFRDRSLRGESTLLPPIDPPEWKAERDQMARNAQEAGERTSEWAKRAAFGRAQWLGLDLEKFKRAWSEAERRGLVPR